MPLHIHFFFFFFQTPTFWILARALKEFVAKEGQGNLPVRGTIPDMIADSGKYIKLQNV